MEEALAFIKANCLAPYQNGKPTENERQSVSVRIKATGGGAFKYADIFQVPSISWISAECAIY